MSGLSAQEQLFADYYLVNFNAAEAAVKAGFEVSNPRTVGMRLSRKPMIQEYIKNQMESKKNALIADQDEILMFLTAVMRNDKDILGIDHNVRLSDRMHSAELLGKRYSLFTEKVQVEGKITSIEVVVE